jgi:hypothetical protein
MARREEEMKKGGKFKKREEEVAELEKALVKIRTRRSRTPQSPTRMAKSPGCKPSSRRYARPPLISDTNSSCCPSWKGP